MCKQHLHVLFAVSVGSDRATYGFPLEGPDVLEGNLRPELDDTAHCKVNNKAIR